LIKNAGEASVQAINLQEEWQMYRYQDGLRWSKIQTVSAIEAGLFAGIYSAPAYIPSSWKITFALLISGVVICMCLLAEKDGRDAEYHLRRAETMMPLASMLGVPKPKPVWGLRGGGIMRAAMAMVTMLNVALIVGLTYFDASTHAVEEKLSAPQSLTGRSRGQ
jgi:hypothetical protein